MLSFSQKLTVVRCAIAVLVFGVGCRPTADVTPLIQSKREPTPSKNAATEVDSHQRMIAKLRDIDTFMKQHSVILSDGRLNEFSAMVLEAKSRGDLAQFISLHVMIGQHHTNMGRGDEALMFFQQAIVLLPEMRQTNAEFMPPSEESALYVLAGLAAIRKAENENCLVCQDGQSCLFPISDEGVHQKREGSELATKMFERALALDPNNFRAIWMLNIAAMTLGEYPDSVPEQYRLPVSRVNSSVPFPKFPNVAAALAIDTMSLAGGVVADDFDGDHYIDFVVSNWDTAGQLEFFHNRGDGTFERLTEAANLVGIVGGLNVNHADYDNDGDQDVLAELGGWVVGDAFHNALFENPGFDRNWIKIELRGTQSNRFGVGARIRLEITDSDSRRSIYRTVGFGSSFGGNPLRQEIGVAAAETIDVIEVYWPTTQQTQRFENVRANQTLRIDERKSVFQVIDVTGTSR